MLVLYPVLISEFCPNFIATIFGKTASQVWNVHAFSEYNILKITLQNNNNNKVGHNECMSDNSN